MPTELYSPRDDSGACRRCAPCESILAVTPQDDLVRSRCGPVKVWTVSVNGHVVAAGRENARGGVGIWLAGEFEDLLPALIREPAASGSGWNGER